MSAFDSNRPPALELIDDCVHCGFCLPTCPTYELWDEEMDSPRGRILFMRAAHEQDEPLGPAQVDAWDNCLGCMACVTACPSGVQYDKLIEDTRAQVERNVRRPLAERRFLFELFPHPGRLRVLAPLLALQRAVRADRLLRLVPARRLSRTRALVRLAPSSRLRETQRRLPAFTPASQPGRGRVGFLQGCVQRVFFAGVNHATVAVLAAEGWEVHAPATPRCCGALQLHSGDVEAARDLARATVAQFEHCDAVVLNAAGCGSAVMDYAHLLSDDHDWAARAAAFVTKVRDITEFLAEHEQRTTRHPVPLTVAFHDACHLAHAQGVRAQPRALLSVIPGIELCEPAEWELCCGSAGIYNLTNVDPAVELGRRKADNLLATGAEAIVSSNPGCSLQIASALAGRGRTLPIYHPIELVHASIENKEVRL